MYTDLYIKKKSSKKFVIIAGVVLLFAALLFLFLQNGISLQIPLSWRLVFMQEKTIDRQEIVNMAPYQAGLFWQTKQKETGFVVYGTDRNSINKVVLDDRDTKDMKKKHLLHYVTFKNLKPNEDYYYRIISGDNVVVKDNKKIFGFRTPKNTDSKSSAVKPAYGKVALPKGSAAEDAWIFLYHGDIYPMMTQTKTNGDWLIPLQSAISKKTNRYISLNDNTDITIEIFNEDLLFSKIETSIKRASPIPKTVVLGKNYRLESSTGNVLSEVTDIHNNNLGEITLHYPKEGAIVPGKRPLIKGTAVPNNLVKVIIKSNPEYAFEVKVNDNGKWKVNVPVDFAPGSYLLVMMTNNEYDKKETIKRYFIIAKDGEQVLGDATESADIEVTEEPVAEDPTSTPEPTEEPSPTPVPTDEPTNIPTKEPTATSIPEPTDEPEITEEPELQDVSPTTSSSYARITEVDEPVDIPTPVKDDTMAKKRKVTVTPKPNLTDPMVAKPTSSADEVTGRPKPPAAGTVDVPFFVTALGFLIIGAGMVFVL